MFNLRKRVENLENQLKIDPVVITEEDLYKFYLERKIDEINARLKYNLNYSIEHNTESIRADGWRFFDMSWTTSIKIKISDIEIKKFTYTPHPNITKKGYLQNNIKIHKLKTYKLFYKIRQEA